MANPLVYLLLRLLHVFQSFYILITSLKKRLFWAPPLPLTAVRRRTPKHLAILFTTGTPINRYVMEKRLLETIDRVLEWCRVIGIERLSLHDREGVLIDCRDKIEQRTLAADYYHSLEDESSDFAAGQLLTPPESEYSDSRPLTPALHDCKESLVSIHCFARSRDDISTEGALRQRCGVASKTTRPSLIIHLLSEQSSKETIASTASALAASHRASSSDDFTLSVKALGAKLEAEYPPPDFMIVHPLSPSMYSREPLELRAFPPWQIRLTEIHLNRYRKRHRNWLMRLLGGWVHTALPLNEIEFREALDEFAAAEMRFGK